MNGHEPHFKVRLLLWTSHDSTDRARHAPVTVTLLYEALLRSMDKWRFKRFYCNHDHGDYSN